MSRFEINNWVRKKIKQRSRGESLSENNNNNNKNNNNNNNNFIILIKKAFQLNLQCQISKT